LAGAGTGAAAMCRVRQSARPTRSRSELLGVRRRRLASASRPSRKPRANHTAEREYDENPAAQRMTRREEDDADHDERHSDDEQDQSERADAADVSRHHCYGYAAA
jgi:hypothetical protein